MVMVVCTIFEKVTGKYGERGIRYTFIEVGHAAQNACLQAVSMGVNSVVIGSFNDSEVKKVINCEISEQPLYIIPFGR